MSSQSGRNKKLERSHRSTPVKSHDLSGQSALVESLEERALLSTDYLLNGNQLTTTVNGVQGTPQTVANINNVQLNGDSGLNRFTIENFSGNATVNGQGGGDLITVFGGGGGTVTVHDSAPTPGLADSLIVRAPTTTQASVTASPTQITVGSDTINYDSTVGAVSLIGQLFSNGDALTVNGSSSAEAVTVSGTSVTVGSGPVLFYSTFNSLTVNGAGGNDTFTVTGDSIPTTINAGSGNAGFVVNSNTVPLTLDGGAGGDTYTINSSSGPLTVNGQSGPNTYIVNGSSSGLTLNGGSASNAYTIASNSASLTVNGAGTANNVTVNANSGSLTVNGGAGTDAFTVNGTTGTVALRGGTGHTAYLISGPTLAPVSVVGGSGAGATGALTFDGTPLPDAFTVTSTSVNAGTGATVTYSHLTSLVVNGLTGNDTFFVTSDTTPTTLAGSTGNDIFNVTSASATLAVSTGSGISTVNIGSNEPATSGNTLSHISSDVTVTGDTLDTLNIDDSADTAATSGTLSSTRLAGISAGAINYSGLAALNIKLGSGGNTLNVTGDANGTVTNISLGSGTNSVDLGSNAPASSGVLDNIQGALTLTGSSNDTLALDDTGATSHKSASLSPTALVGLSTGSINYAGIKTLTIGLGSGGDNFAISNTNAGTATTVNGGSGNDTFLVLADSSTTHLTTGGGSDHVSVQSVLAATTITSAGNSSILVSIAPTLGTLGGIAAALTITGAGSDTLTLDDSGDSSNSTGTLTATSVAGLGMGSAGVAYSGLAQLNVLLGSATNSLQVTNTASAMTTNITGGAGGDTINVAADASPTNINTGGGANVVNVQNTAATTTITAGSGANTVNVGSNQPLGNGIVDGIQGTLSVVGGGNTSLNVDDTGNPFAKTVSLTSTSFTGASPAAINYDAGVSSASIALGSGNDVVSIVSTSATATTSINTGIGTDAVAIQATSGPTNISTGGGANTVTVSSNAPATGGTLENIDGPATITGGGSDSLTMTDSADAHPRVAALNAGGLVGLSPSPINFSGVSNVVVNLDNYNNALTVSNTITGTTTVNSGTGNNTITLQADSGTTTVNASSGGDTINVQSTNGATAIAAAVTGADVVNIGSNTPAGSGVLDHIAGAVGFAGNGYGTLNIDDTGSTSSKTGTLSSVALLGLGSAGITYDGLSALNIGMGAGNNTLTVASTATGTPTTITSGSGNNTFNIQSDTSTTTLNDGSGANIVNVGSTMPATGGVLDNIAGLLHINGGGKDTLNLDDSGNAVGKTAALSPTSVQGISPAAITYSGLAALNVNMGSGADALTVSNTAAGTATTIYSGTGNDAVTVQNNSSPTTVNAGAGSDQVNLRETNAATTVTTATGGNNTIDIGSNAPSGNGVLAAIAGAVTVQGSGADTLNLDDTANRAAASGNVSASSISGLSPANIAYSGLANLNINLGDAGNAVTVADTASGTATVVNSGAGADQINVRATHSPTTVNAGAGANTIDVGSGAPATGGTVSAITGPVTVNGSGADTMNVDDTGDTISRSGTLNPTILALGPATIAYGGLSILNVSLGPADDNLDVVNTATSVITSIATGAGNDILTLENDAGPTTVETDSGNDTVNVRGTAAPTVVQHTGSGTDTFNVGSTAPAAGGVLDQLLVSLTVKGGGNDAMNVDDTGSPSPETGSLSPVLLAGLGSSGIKYSGLSRLAIDLGSGGTTFDISNTHSGTTSTVNAAAGNNTISLSDDSAATNVNTTGGSNAIAIQATHSATTITNTVGTDTVVAGSVAPHSGGVFDNLAGALSVTGNGPAGPTTLTLDDAGSTSGKSVVVAAASVSGLSPAAVAYRRVSSLTLALGSGGDTVAVQSTAAGTATTIGGGSGNDAFTVSPAANAAGGLSAALAGPISIDAGGGSNTLVVDDSADKASRSTVLTPIAISGLGGPLNYANFNSLGLQLGSGGGGLEIDEINPFTATTITTARNDQSSRIHLSANFGGDFAGNLSVGSTNGGTLSVGGNLTGSLAVGGALDSVTIGQAVSGSLAVSGDVGSLSIGGDLSGTVSTGGNLGTATISGKLSGVFTTGGTVTTLTQAGDLSGQTSIGGDLSSATVSGSLTGSLTVGNRLGTLTVGGSEPGTIAAGASGTVGVAAATADSAGDLFNMTQAGVTRTINASAADGTGGAPLAGLSFGVLYDATAGVPQAALRVIGGSTGNARFDLLVSAPAAAAFNLSRLDTATGAAAANEIRNVSVDGSVLGSVTAAEQAYFGYPQIVSAKPPKKGQKRSVKTSVTPAPGGVQLPGDDLAVVSARNDIRAGSINAAGVEGLAFVTLTDANRVAHPATTAVGNSRGFRNTLLLSALATDPTTHKTTTQILPAADPLVVEIGPGNPVGLFEGTTSGFNPRGLLLSDQGGKGSTVTATASYVPGTPPGKAQVANLGFAGNGGAIDTYLPVQNINSTDALGDVLLRAGKAEVLQTLNAPSVFGTVNLYGGTIVSTNIPGIAVGKPTKVAHHRGK